MRCKLNDIFPKNEEDIEYAKILPGEFLEVKVKNGARIVIHIDELLNGAFPMEKDND